MKSGACQSCHALGTPGTRTISKRLGTFKDSADAWAERLQAGSASMFMARDITHLDTQKALELFGKWTDGIAAGELPFATHSVRRGSLATSWSLSENGAIPQPICTTQSRPTVGIHR